MTKGHSQCNYANARSRLKSVKTVRSLEEAIGRRNKSLIFCLVLSLALGGYAGPKKSKAGEAVQTAVAAASLPVGLALIPVVSAWMVLEQVSQPIGDSGNRPAAYGSAGKRQNGVPVAGGRPTAHGWGRAVLPPAGAGRRAVVRYRPLEPAGGLCHTGKWDHGILITIDRPAVVSRRGGTLPAAGTGVGVSVGAQAIMKILKAFERAGISEEQVEAVTDAIGEAAGKNDSTQVNLPALKADLRALELRLSKQLWATVVGIVTANAAVMFGLLKLLR